MMISHNQSVAFTNISKGVVWNCAPLKIKININHNLNVMTIAMFQVASFLEVIWPPVKKF